MQNPIDSGVATLLRSYAVLAVVALLLGAATVPYAAAVATAEPDRVVVVSIDETIADGTAGDTIRTLRSLRDNDSVKAVVLRVSSPGGGAAASESLYLAVKRLAAEKRVVASVGAYAVSGAYYASVPSDRIFVTPGSIVGHVGVIATAPTEELPRSATTGPDKAQSGMTKDEFYAAIESMKRSFVGAVMDERGDRLNVSRETVAEASAYAGGRAVRTGYADAVGDLDAAIAAAAEAEGLSDYAVTYRNPASSPGFFLRSDGDSPAANGTADGARSPFGYSGVETVHFLMVYGVPETQTVLYDTADAGGT
ncbi:MAG: S49 family peptidase [Halobacteriales archaeon]